MWIVRLALRRPYTFVVAAMLVLILGIVSILRMPTDIFPEIDIPVVSVVFNYSGMPADEMEKRIVSNFERGLTTIVNDIDHIESQSVSGVAVVKVYFNPGGKVDVATAQITSVAQTFLRQSPPGLFPPLILRYSASNAPILQMGLGSDKLTEQDLFDLGANFIRSDLATVQGAQIPWPYGGKQKQIVVDLDPEKLYAWGLSPADISAAINAQNVIVPAGDVRIGPRDLPVRVNASPEDVSELNDLPIKNVKNVDGTNTTVYIRDVAHVRVGFQVQNSIVHADGKRGVLLPVLKSSGASTLDIVNRVRAALPAVLSRLPPELKLNLMFDQSVFVRAAVSGVVKEAAIAAGLTALMILLFLGSWRSTLIVVISIPLSILVSIIILAALGQSLNVMTLGGMALAVGILVDDATVEIENIHRNLHQRKRLVQAILDGAQQIAVPAFVSTLCICIVFVPVVFISGSAKSLFTPLAMAVVFAMMTSYLLSRTLVPTMIHYLLASEVERYGGKLDPSDPHQQQAIHEKEEAALGHPCEHEGPLCWLRHALARRGVRIALIATVAALAVLLAVLSQTVTKGFFGDAWGWMREHRSLFEWAAGILVALAIVVWLANRYNLIWRTHDAFNRQFERFRRLYGGMLTWALEHKLTTVAAFLVLVVASLAIFPLIGTDFFPSVDAGQIRMHVRCPPGTRLDETERYFGEVEQVIRQDIPDRELVTILDNMGIPNSSINMSLSEGTLMSPADGEILISLKEDHHPTPAYVRKLRQDLPQKFPELTFYFMAPDIATQVLNFGLAAPIDVQIDGPPKNAAENNEIAHAMLADLNHIPGCVDAHLQQVATAPDLRVNVDRTLAQMVGVTQRDVTSDLLVSLSGTANQNPNFWLNPKTGVQYNILVMTPPYRINSEQALENTPVMPTGVALNGPVAPDSAQLLGNLATIERGTTAANITHNNIRPTSDILASVQGAPLGTVSSKVQEVVDRYKDRLPRGSEVRVRGQVESMHSSFVGLGYGLIFAVVLVYLLMVVNFQSWIDPLIILMALPGALAGILWMLFITGTTISVPSLMGAIMSIGVATTNSILMITFANDQRKHGMNSHDAALAAGLTRLRPVMMTALAMIIGMLPMSLGLGEGGEQNAPLGRAVIGGLGMATFATLFFVPIVYSVLRHKPPVTQVEEELK